MPNKFKQYRAVSSEDSRKEQTEEMENIRKKYKYLEKWGSALLGSHGWNFVIDPSVPTACAHFESRTIAFGTKMESKIADPKPEKAELKRLFVHGHELMHFVQGMEATEEYLETFQIARRKAEEYADRYPDIKQKDLLRTFNRQFFNTFLDINDNGKVVRRNKKLQNDLGRESTEDLYGKLFPYDNISNQMLSDQFACASIMKIMDPDRKVVCHEKVNEILTGKFKYLGRDYPSFLDFIKEKIHNPDEPTDRAIGRISKVVLPIFEKLLTEDIEGGNYTPPPEDDGGLDGGIAEGDLEKFAKKFRESPQKQSAQDRRNQRAQEQRRENLKNYGFGEKEISEMEQIMENTDEVWKSMMDLWERFFCRSVEYTLEKGGAYHSGEFSVPNFVRDLPKFVSKPDRSKPFRREEVVSRRENWRPRKLSLIFATDLSSSMNEGNKRRAVQEAYYALAKSFIQFQRNQIIKSDDGRTPVNSYIRNIGFGSSHLDLLELTDREKESRLIDPTTSDLDKRFWRSVLDIKKDLKRNNDPTYLDEWTEEAERAKEKLESGDEIMLIIELTDGDPEAQVAAHAKEVLADLSDCKNVHIRAIRIGGESNFFDGTWGDKGKILPDEDVSRLKEVFVDLMEDVFAQYRQN